MSVSFFNKDFPSLQKWNIEARFQDGKGRVNVTKKQMASRSLKSVLHGGMLPQYARCNHTPNLTEIVVHCTDHLVFWFLFHSGMFQSRILKQWLQPEVILSTRAPLLLIQIEQMEAVVTREVPVGSGPCGVLHGAYYQDAHVYLWEVEQVAEQTQHRAGLRTQSFPSWTYRHALDLPHHPKLSNISIFLFSASGSEPRGYTAMSTDGISVCSFLWITLYSFHLGNGP